MFESLMVSNTISTLFMSVRLATAKAGCARSFPVEVLG